MAVVYLDSAAVGAADGTTFDDAYTTWQAAFTGAGAGGTIYMDDGHTETITQHTTFTHAGTYASPVKVISVDKGSASDTSTVGGSADANYSKSVTNNITANSTHTLTFGASNDSTILVGVQIQIKYQLVVAADSTERFDDCYFDFDYNDASNLNLSPYGSHVYFNNCQFKLASGTSQGFEIDGIGSVYIRNCSVVAAALATGLFRTAAFGGGKVVIEDCDLSGLATSGNIITALPATHDDQAFYEIANVKLPTSGGITSDTFEDPGSYIIASNVSASDVVYSRYYEDFFGKMVDDTGNYRTGGATYDGTNEYSAKVTTDNVVEFHQPFRFLLTERYLAAADIVTVEFLTEGVTLQDDEVWIEVVYPTASSGSLGGVATTRMADAQATPANLSTSSETWTDDFAGSQVKQYAQVDLSTLNQAGNHEIWVCAAKPSLTMYVDFEVDIT